MKWFLQGLFGIRRLTKVVRLWPDWLDRIRNFHGLLVSSLI